MIVVKHASLLVFITGIQRMRTRRGVCQQTVAAVAGRDCSRDNGLKERKGGRDGREQVSRRSWLGFGYLAGRILDEIRDPGCYTRLYIKSCILPPKSSRVHAVFSTIIDTAIGAHHSGGGDRAVVKPEVTFWTASSTVRCPRSEYSITH